MFLRWQKAGKVIQGEVIVRNDSKVVTVVVGGGVETGWSC